MQVRIDGDDPQIKLRRRASYRPVILSEVGGREASGNAVEGSLAYVGFLEQRAPGV
jgi:hypothetical protein